MKKALDRPHNRHRDQIRSRTSVFGYRGVGEAPDRPHTRHHDHRRSRMCFVGGCGVVEAQGNPIPSLGRHIRLRTNLSKTACLVEDGRPHVPHRDLELYNDSG